MYFEEIEYIHNHSTITQIRNFNITITLFNFRLYSTLINCPNNVFCNFKKKLLKMQSRITSAFSYHISLVSSNVDQFLSSSFMMLTFFEEHGTVILQNIPQFGFVYYFPTTKLRLRMFGQEYHESDGSSQCILSGHTQRLFAQSLIIWLRWGLSGLSFTLLLRSNL